jgi:HAD superfamily hydrolase (TIGR01509 family)
VLGSFGVTVSPEEYGEHWIGRGRGPEYAVKTFGLPLGPDELRAIKKPVYHEILRSEVKLMPGVLEALTRLYKCFPLAVATNSNLADVSFAMDHLGVRRFFTAIVTRDDYALAKPHPDAFLTAAARLGATPRTCLVVEDAHKGIVAAHRAGATVVAVPNAFTRYQDFSLAATVLRSLDELTLALVHKLLLGRNGV